VCTGEAEGGWGSRLGGLERCKLHPAFAKAGRVVSRIEGQPHWEILTRRLLGDCWELSELLGLPGDYEVEGGASRSQSLINRPRSSTVGTVELLLEGGFVPRSSRSSRVDRNPYGIIIDGAG
jgi:hypothetical protein